MAQPFPYTYYACACSENKSHSGPAKRSSQQPHTDDEDERTFDPRNPRSAYSLYPLSHLLYCEDCRQIRCPRCVIEETLNWFCPSCLFEVPSSVVKSDGNRCTRNCYNCPVCTAPMPVASLEDPEREREGGKGGPYVLSCPYCHWSSCEIGVEFEKATGITGQLARIGNGGTVIPTAKERDKERERLREKETRRMRDVAMGRAEDANAGGEGDTEDEDGFVERDGQGELSHDDLFSNLSAFYKSQLAAQTPANAFAPHDLSFSSPSSFSRIMNLYSTTSTSKSQKRQKPAPMREAGSALEGLVPHSPTSDEEAIERLRKEGWGSTLSPLQKVTQEAVGNPGVRFDSDLRPVATLLCTKRGKRCTTCRHILSKPEAKITSTRYKIKLLALNHIPRLSIRYLPPPQHPSTSNNTPSISILPPLPSALPTGTATPLPDQTILRPGLPTHFLLHLSNPLFDPIRVTLATPSITPGRIQSRVTILCPQFEVGANTDVWDDALANPSSSPSMTPRSGSVSEGYADMMEAGKIWDRGRNWTSVAVEVVPGFLSSLKGLGATSPGRKKMARESGKRNSGFGLDKQLEFSREEEDEGLVEDDDVLEIPIFVRIEFESEVGEGELGTGAGAGKRDGGEGGSGREKREEAFWTVVGVGRIMEV